MTSLDCSEQCSTSGQVGPYVFTEQHEKASIVWNPDNGTVTYRQIRSWHFLPDLSNGQCQIQH
jgi:hypothetical protein